MDADDLKKRTKLFALRVLKLAAALPNTIECKVIRGQLVRAGTSVGANYRASCRARSRAEFIAKIGVVIEESDESGYWLELIMDGGFMSTVRVMPLLTEAVELTKIMTQSRVTALARNMSKERKANRQSKIFNQK
ncbi:MAG TPA: four helix bundle protein [Pyrinomonadaceae bacterium]|nr:four helix bundle protein [Pyrinomonadaceae bacterium]